MKIPSDHDRKIVNKYANAIISSNLNAHGIKAVLYRLYCQGCIDGIHEAYKLLDKH